MRRRIYLDHNATSPMSDEVAGVLAAAQAAAWANPHSPHAEGQAAAAALEEARLRVAGWLGVAPREVCFTSGATESNSTVLAAFAGEGRRVGSAVEHPSVDAWLDERLPVDGEGRLRLEALEARLRASEGPPALLSVMAANNETGVLQPLDEVVALAEEWGVPLHVDATQLVGRLDPDLHLPGGDFWTLSSHKLGGPRGVGVLVARSPLPPLLRGGPQERGLRAGTPAVPAIVAFERALAAATVRVEDGEAPGYGAELSAGLAELGGTVLSAGAPRLPNTACALFELPGDLLVMGLDLEGVAASTGSACSSGSAVPSHVLAAMGLEGTPVRLSTGPDTDQDAIAAALGALERVLERARSA